MGYVQWGRKRLIERKGYLIVDTNTLRDDDYRGHACGFVLTSTVAMIFRRSAADNDGRRSSPESPVQIPHPIGQSQAFV